VSVFTHTGAISTHEVYLPDPPNAPDPFRYSEVGEVAGE
jgi:hypothetical protein